MTDSIAILAEHVANTLPDSISKRIQLLQAMLKVVAVGHPARKNIQSQLFNLQTAVFTEQELPGLFVNPKGK